MYGDDVNIIANLNEEESTTKFKISGRYQDVKAYAMAISAEKEFLDAYMEFGPEHPQTVLKKEELRNDVSNFESVTGLSWPFKDED
tara:strand:- start:108 stop:365 length:258 start_codon:yes stop_codon:yes gene_type:complete